MGNSKIVDADKEEFDDENDGLKKPPHKKAVTVKAELVALSLGPITHCTVSN